MYVARSRASASRVQSARKAIDSCGKPAVEIAAQLRLGPADAALIDQDQIALYGIRLRHDTGNG